MTIIVIDCGLGNLGSVLRSLEICGSDAIASRNPGDLKTASSIVLPGVGAFGDGMENLHKGGWVDILREEVLGNKIPLLGICLGMQLLADGGTEGTQTGAPPIPGLGFIKGNVIKLQPHDQSEKIPHVGWNEVNQTGTHPIFNAIENHKDFYFVHSYHFAAASKEDIIATTPYCGEFASAIAHENIIGVQFHPEKSQIAGFQLLKNFLLPC